MITKDEKEFYPLLHLVREEQGIDKLKGDAKLQADSNLVDEILKFSLDPDVLDISCIERYIEAKYSKEKLQELRGKVEETLEEKTKQKPNYVEDIFLYFNNKGKVIGVNTDVLADYLIQHNSFKTIFWTKGETIYIFQDGIWLPTGREFIETQTEKLLQQFTKNSIVWEILGKIKRQTAISIDEFNKTSEGIICIENGIFDLKVNKLYDFSDKYYFKTKIPVTYDPNADCPTIKKFLSENLYGIDILTLQEWIGFNLYNRYFEKKAVIVFGGGDTGKTVLLNLLSKFIGKENVSNLSLHRIGIGKSFDLLNLKDKYSNIHDDLSSRDLVDIGGFKMATGSSTISGEVKFGDTITFTSFAKQTFAANKIPPITDIDEDAYYEKWIPIACDNKIPKSEQDKNLIQKLTTEAELSGLFNWAIEGLYRLIKNNGFSFDKSPTEVKEIMMRSGHHLSAFAQDCLEKEDGHKISKDNMFVYYTCWCEKNHKARMSKEQLGRQLERFVPYILASRGKERYWNNVRLKLSIYDTYDTFLKSYKEYKNKDKDNLNVYIFSEKETQVSQNKEEFTLLPESKQDVGRCSYCGKISLLKYKDDKGNYACSYCADKEENNV